MSLRVAMVGCGTAGPAAALFLHAQGHAVQVFERVPELGPVGAGILIQPTGMTALARLGLLEKIILTGERVDHLRGWTRSGRVVMDLSYADLDAGFFGLGVHRGDLFNVLWAALQACSIPVHCGVEVASLEGRTLLDRDGVDLGEFDMVVVADGARSELRGRSGLEKRATPYPYGALWFVANDPEGLFAGSLDQYYDGTRRMLGFLPTGTNPADAQDETPWVSLFWSVAACEVEATRRRGIEAFKGELRRLSERVEPILDELEDIDQLVFAQYWDVRMPRWTDGTVVYIGDAAHAMSPQLGQGANLALYDAMVLADCVSTHSDLRVALAQYERERRAHLRYYQVASRWLTPIFQSDMAALGWVRDLVLGSLCGAPWVRGQMLRSLAGLKTGLFSAWPVDVVSPKVLGGG